MVCPDQTSQGAKELDIAPVLQLPQRNPLRPCLDKRILCR